MNGEAGPHRRPRTRADVPIGNTVRRTADGRHTLAYPFREDGTGKPRCWARPIDSRTRTALERQVLRALSLGERSAP